MATKKRPILIRVQPYNYEKLKAIADMNSRSISNQLEYLMVQYIRDFEKQNGTISFFNDSSSDNNDSNVKISVTQQNGEKCFSNVKM